MPDFDAKDAEICAQRVATYAKIVAPRVGDFIRMRDGTLRRFTHDWGDGMQTTVGDKHPCTGDASFYFGDGYMSFSGALDPAIPLQQIESTDEIQLGSVWFFHHNETRAHNGVYTKIPFRVYRQK